MSCRTISIDVDLRDFDTDDLIEELESRGEYNTEPTMGESDELIDKIFHLRRQGRDFEKELDQLLYNKTGRAI